MFRGPSKAWKKTYNAERPANACEETCERMQRDLRKRPTQETYNVKRPANASEETYYNAWKETYKCMYRDLLMHVKRPTNACKETY